MADPTRRKPAFALDIKSIDNGLVVVYSDGVSRNTKQVYCKDLSAAMVVIERGIEEWDKAEIPAADPAAPKSPFGNPLDPFGGA